MWQVLVALLVVVAGSRIAVAVRLALLALVLSSCVTTGGGDPLLRKAATFALADMDSYLFERSDSWVTPGVARVSSARVVGNRIDCVTVQVARSAELFDDRVSWPVVDRRDGREIRQDPGRQWPGDEGWLAMLDATTMVMASSKELLLRSMRPGSTATGRYEFDVFRGAVDDHTWVVVRRLTDMAASYRVAWDAQPENLSVETSGVEQARAAAMIAEAVAMAKAFVEQGTSPDGARLMLQMGLFLQWPTR